MENDFSKGKVWRVIINQAAPLTLAQLVQILYNIVDRIYIGHLPKAGSEALTGLGIIFPITILTAAFTNLFASGGTPIFAMARGAKNEERAGKTMGNVFTLLTVSSVLIMILGYVFKRDILFLFGASNESYVYAREYLNIYLAGTLFSMLSAGLNGFINAEGFPKIGMVTTLMGAAMNMVLDPIFIFCLDMGVSGAALATVISQAASAIWVMKFLTGKKAVIRLELKYLRPSFKMSREIMTLGLSGFIMQATNCAVQIACNTTLKAYGGAQSDIYIGVMTAVNSVREILSLPASSLGNGAQSVLSYNYGAKKYERVKEGIRFTAIVGVLYTFFAWICVTAFPQMFIKMFTDDVQMSALGTGAVRIYFFGFFFMAFQFAGQSTFMALGKSGRAIFFSILRKGIIVVPLTLLLPRVCGLGVNGVFMAEPISNAIGGLASFITMYFTVYRHLGKDVDKEMTRC